MAIRPRSERKRTKQVIDLDGPQGNAFFLLGTAQTLAKTLMLDGDSIQEEMKSGDYEHLIETFDKYFGDLVDLQR